MFQVDVFKYWRFEEEETQREEKRAVKRERVVWITNAESRSVYIGSRSVRVPTVLHGGRAPAKANQHDSTRYTRGKLLFALLCVVRGGGGIGGGRGGGDVPPAIRLLPRGRMSSFSFKSRLPCCALQAAKTGEQERRPTDALFKAQRGVDYSSLFYSLSLTAS